MIWHRREDAEGHGEDEEHHSTVRGHAIPGGWQWRVDRVSALRPLDGGDFCGPSGAWGFDWLGAGFEAIGK